jgi:hypothetical protein
MTIKDDPNENPAEQGNAGGADIVVNNGGSRAVIVPENGLPSNPAAVVEWQPPDWPAKLGHVEPDEMLDRLRLVAGPEPDDEEDDELAAAWRTKMEVALRAMITQAQRANLESHHAAALVQHVEYVETETRKNHENLEERAKKFRENNYPDNESQKPVIEWAKQKLKTHWISSREAINTLFRHLIREKQRATQRDIDERTVSLIARGADPEIVVHDTARAVARGKGDSSYMYELKDQIHNVVVYKRKQGETAKVRFVVNDFPGIGEYLLRTRLPGLEFGVISNTFNIPTPLLNHLIQDTLMKSAIIEDPWKRDADNKIRIVVVDSRLVKEIREYLARRCVVNDAAPRSSDGGGKTLDLQATRIATSAPAILDAGPRFGDVLILDPKAWTSTKDIRSACDAVWRAWCAGSGVNSDVDKNFIAALKAWAGLTDHDRKKGPVGGGERGWGYRGVRLVQG